MSEQRRYRQSEVLLEEALEFIPLGAQTFSKSITQYPRGAAPLFIDRAEGSTAWDVDGNRYVDFNNSLCAITLGHCDPDVTQAVEHELRRGTIFSLSSAIEVEVARLIAETVPCAEKVRFGKNGSDATSGVIRAARAFTGREHVAVCGYHGWQDWYIGSTLRNKGVPQCTRDLTHGFAYNDLASLERLLGEHPGQFAAVILEPMNVAWPDDGFLQGVVDLAARHGAVSIFDETITGFRFSLGGAQELFGVTPDLACFGKGLANGYPLSAVTGRADVMREFEEIFFSFTMGGERLSLAAAVAAITKARDAEVPTRLAQQGQKILDGLGELIGQSGSGEFLSTAGHPSWSFLLIRDTEKADQWAIRTLFLQEMLQRGVLTLGTHNMSFAHSDEDVDQILSVYSDVLPILAAAVRDSTVADQLQCEPLKPLFRVR